VKGAILMSVISEISEIITPIVYQLGVGGIVGFVAGYVIKKITKIILIVFGIFVIALMYLGYKNIITINYSKLIDAVTGLLGEAGVAKDLLVAIISYLPVAGSFIAGLFIGWKMG
jgi:uncharacterized membrane protein (Fun14 family)